MVKLEESSVNPVPPTSAELFKIKVVGGQGDGVADGPVFVRLALHARKAGKGDAAVGFKARRSWNLVQINTCPISDRRLVEALPALRALAAPFLEHPKSAPTLHVTWTASGLDVDITGVERRS